MKTRKSIAKILIYCLIFLICIVSIEWASWFSRPDLYTGQEQASMLAGNLDRSNALSQTFLADSDELTAVEVFARVPPGRFNDDYKVLFSIETGGKQILKKSISLQKLQSQPRIHLRFPVQYASKGQEYTIQIETNAPPKTVSLLASPEDVYFNGELYQNNSPTNRDLAFRGFTAVTPSRIVRELYGLRIELLYLLLITIFVGFVGVVGIVLFGHLPGTGDGSTFISWLPGIGVGVLIILFTVLGERWMWGLVLLVLFAFILIVRRPSRFVFPSLQNNLSDTIQILALFAWSLAIRLFQVSDLPAPLWVDGYRNYEIIERILAEGRIPGGLLYHTGYHGLVFIFNSISILFSFTDLSLPRIMLLVGQWIGAFGILSVYLLARKILKGSHTAALIAVLFYSLFFAFPGYLFNWGRYPFQLGLALLPLVLVSLIELVNGFPCKFTSNETNKLFLPQGMLALILIISTGLAHYGTISFLISFCMAWFLVEHRNFRGINKRQLLRSLVFAGIVLTGAFLLFGLFRFGPAFWKPIGENWTEVLAQSRQASEDLDYSGIISIYFSKTPAWLFMAVAIGILQAAWRDRWLLALTAGWSLIHTILITIQAPLFGYALASYGNLLLILSIPGSLLSASLFDRLFNLYKQRMHRSGYLQYVLYGQAFFSIALIVVAVLGGLSFAKLLNPATVLMGPQDKEAIIWLRSNIPSDAAILVNSNYWGSEEVVPSDGGIWINAFTDNSTVYLTSHLDELGLVEYVQQEKIDYLYLGRFSGFFSTSLLSKNRYEQVYAKDGVKIFEVIR